MKSHPTVESSASKSNGVVYCGNCGVLFNRNVQHSCPQCCTAGCTDDSEAVADGGTLTGHILTTVGSLTDQDQRGKRAYPRTADVLDLLLIEREESLTEICNELARLVKHGELYRPSGQTIAVTSPTDGGELSDAEAADVLEGLLTKIEPALDESERDELGQVIDHLRSGDGSDDIPVIAEEGDA